MGCHCDVHCDCFHKLKNLHHGTVHHCFLCIPVKLGTHLIGIFMTVQMVLWGLALWNMNRKRLTWVDFLPVIWFIYPVFRYVRMICSHHDHHKHGFGKAYQCFALLNSSALALYGIVVTVLNIIWIANDEVKTDEALKNTGLTLGVVFLAIFINVHFARVVNTYTHHVDGFFSV